MPAPSAFSEAPTVPQSPTNISSLALPVLASPARWKRFQLCTIRGEFHRRRAARWRSVHRRSLWRRGSAVFEVTRPRVTCYRVGIRMDKSQMAALLVSHGRPGFYFRVIQEGGGEAGNSPMVMQVS